MTLAELFGANVQEPRTKCGKNDSVGHCGTATSNAPNCVETGNPSPAGC